MNIALQLSVLFAIARAASVSHLTRATFEDFITNHDVVTVNFYAPWCSVCKELEPIYEATAANYHTEKDIEFARVDCVHDDDLCKRWVTPIYPTLRIFKGLEEQEIYHGPRTPAEIIKAAEWFWLPNDSNGTTVGIEAALKENEPSAAHLESVQTTEDEL